MRHPLNFVNWAKAGGFTIQLSVDHAAVCSPAKLSTVTTYVRSVTVMPAGSVVDSSRAGKRVCPPLLWLAHQACVVTSLKTPSSDHLPLETNHGTRCKSMSGCTTGVPPEAYRPALVDVNLTSRSFRCLCDLLSARVQETCSPSQRYPKARAAFLRLGRPRGCCLVTSHQSCPVFATIYACILHIESY